MDILALLWNFFTWWHFRSQHLARTGFLVQCLLEEVRTDPLPGSQGHPLKWQQRPAGVRNCCETSCVAAMRDTCQWYDCLSVWGLLWQNTMAWMASTADWVSHSLGTWKSKIRGPAWSYVGWGPYFWLDHHMASLGVCTERKNTASHPLFTRVFISSPGDVPKSVQDLNTDCIQKTPIKGHHIGG